MKTIDQETEPTEDIDYARFAARYSRYNMAEHGMTELQPEVIAALEALTSSEQSVRLNEVEQTTNNEEP